MIPYRILVVDDDEMNLTLVGRILGLDGYQVMLAGDAQKAVQSVVEGIPDLIILDVMMPDMNGFELCRKLRQPPLNVSGPIVMLTAMNSEIEKQQALDAGANEIWSKPFDIGVLRRRISELLASTGPSRDIINPETAH